jgi:hypothetical protein
VRLYLLSGTFLPIVESCGDVERREEEGTKDLCRLESVPLTLSKWDAQRGTVELWRSLQSRQEVPYFPVWK